MNTPPLGISKNVLYTIFKCCDVCAFTYKFSAWLASPIKVLLLFSQQFCVPDFL